MVMASATEQIPAISVVLPFRNASRWLNRTLASLASECNLPWELVAVNDGSTDNSSQIVEAMCQHWTKQSVQLLHTSGIGVSAARNHAAKAARAPFLAFLDADDRAIAGRLRAPLQRLQADPGLSHVMGGWQRIDAAGQPLQTVQPWQEGASFDLVGALTHKSVLPSSWTIRRSCFLALGGFNTNLAHAEDVDLLLRLAASGRRGAWIEQPLCRYRVHPDAASQQLQGQIEGLQTVIERHLEPLQQRWSRWADGIRYGTSTWCSWKAWIHGESALALELLAQARHHCPMPLPRRPVHFFEHLARSCRREGLPFDRQAVLASPFWQQAKQLLLSTP